MLTLTKGKVLVITGPQGCGKSTLARDLAAEHGTWIEIEASDMEDKFSPWLADSPDTLIIDDSCGTGLPSIKEKIKKMITNPTVVCHRKMMPPIMVSTPNIIFLTGSVEPFPTIKTDRRFSVLRLGEC